MNFFPQFIFSFTEISDFFRDTWAEIIISPFFYFIISRIWKIIKKKLRGSYAIEERKSKSTWENELWISVI